MNGLNLHVVVGNIGNDVKLTKVGRDSVVCKFSVATNRKWESGGELKEATDWHNVQAWGKLGEAVAKHRKKGDAVAVVGRVQYGEYINKDQERVRTTDTVASEVIFL